MNDSSTNTFQIKISEFKKKLQRIPIRPQIWQGLTKNWKPLINCRKVSFLNFKGRSISKYISVTGSCVENMFESACVKNKETSIAMSLMSLISGSFLVYIDLYLFRLPIYWLKPRFWAWTYPTKYSGWLVQTTAEFKTNDVQRLPMILPKFLSMGSSELSCWIGRYIYRSCKKVSSKLSRVTYVSTEKSGVAGESRRIWSNRIWSNSQIGVFEGFRRGGVLGCHDVTNVTKSVIY